LSLGNFFGKYKKLFNFLILTYQVELTYIGLVLYFYL